MDKYIYDWEVWYGDEHLGWTCEAYANELREEGYLVVRPVRCSP